MKLRLKGNTVRLRLSQSEVKKLAAEGCVQEETNFGGNRLLYQIKKDKNNTQLTASFINNELTILMTLADAESWPNNTIISLHNHPAGSAPPDLFILVEKDFKCIDASTEDQSDNYDNPKIC